jgi:hypothetical protein
MASDIVKVINLYRFREGKDGRTKENVWRYIREQKQAELKRPNVRSALSRK